MHFKNPFGATVTNNFFSISVSILNRLFILRNSLTAVFGLFALFHGLSNPSYFNQLFGKFSITVSKTTI